MLHQTKISFYIRFLVFITCVWFLFFCGNMHCHLLVIIIAFHFDFVPFHIAIVFIVCPFEYPILFFFWVSGFSVHFFVCSKPYLIFFEIIHSTFRIYHLDYYNIFCKIQIYQLRNLSFYHDSNIQRQHQMDFLIVLFFITNPNIYRRHSTDIFSFL